MTVQQWCRRAFHEPSTRTFLLVNDFFAALTILSVAALVLETVPSFARYSGAFFALEYIAVFFFLLEYLGRVIAAERPRQYIFSFFGIIDLLAIVPTLLGAANFTFVKSVRILRLLRFLRVLRLAKLSRLAVRDDGTNHEVYRITLLIYATALSASIVIVASLMWIAEGHRADFATIPYAMLWATKVLLGGVPQTMPETLSGEFVTIFGRFVGLLLFGLLLNVVGQGLKHLLFGVQEATAKKK